MNAREKCLADALWRMMLMHEAMLAETEIENIPYQHSTRREMGEAPMQAEQALRAVGYPALPLKEEELKPDERQGTVPGQTKMSLKIN